MKILNLAHGLNPIPGAVNTDIMKLLPETVLHDMNELPWPFLTNYFDKIYCTGALKYCDPLKYFKIVEEMHRILKPEGTLVIKNKNMNETIHTIKLYKNSMRYFIEGDYYQQGVSASFKIISYSQKRSIMFFREPEHTWVLQKVRK